MPRHQNIFPAMKVFVCGVDVSDDVVSVHTQNSLDGKPGTCQIGLASPRFKYVLTPQDVLEASKERVSFRKGRDADPELVDNPFPKSLSAPDTNIQSVTPTGLDWIKGKVILEKQKVNDKIREEYDKSKDVAAAIIAKLNAQQILTDSDNLDLHSIRRYDFRAGYSIFHAGDPIRIAIRHPRDHSRWYWAFAGFVADISVAHGSNHDTQVSIFGEDILRLLRLSRTFINPGQIDQWNAILDGLDASFDSFQSNPFVDMSIADIFASVIFGTDIAGQSSKLQNTAPRTGSPGAPTRQGWHGIGKFNDVSASRSRVFVLDNRDKRQILAAIDGNRGESVEKEVKEYRRSFKRFDIEDHFYDGQVMPPTRISSQFGQRDNRLHAGVDIPGDIGQGVMAWKSGIVQHAGLSTTDGGAAGLYVSILHEDHWTSRYLHLDAVTVRPGDWVDKWQIIGTLGNTGRSSGPHLHFESRDPSNKPQDPMIHAADYPFIAASYTDPMISGYEPYFELDHSPTIVYVDGRGAATQKETLLLKYEDMLKPCETIYPYLEAVDHEVTMDDMDNMLNAPPGSGPELADHARQIEVVRAGGMVEEAIRLIGTNPELYPVDGGRLLMLLPGILAERFDVVVQDVAGAGPKVTNSQFVTRLQMLYDVAAYINFHFYCTPKGDLVLEFPLEDFNPDHLDGPNSGDKKFSDVYTVGEEDTFGFDNVSNDSKVSTIAHATWNIARLWPSRGQADTMTANGRIAIVDLPLLQLYGPRVVALSPAGFIGSQEAAEAFMRLHLNRTNATAFTVRADILPHPGRTLNRPLFIHGAYSIGNISNIGFNVQWASDFSTKIDLQAVRPWDGEIDADGRPVFLSLGGPAGKVWDYKTMMFSDKRGAKE